MKILSGYFGEIDVRDDRIIEFKEAIPGFDGMHKYFIILEEGEGKEEDGLFCWLHSAENGDVAFALLDVFKIMNTYQPEIEEEHLKELKFTDGDTIVVHNIVNIPEKIEDMTVNLIAPIVLNLSKMTGKQVVLSNEGYSLKHRIFDEIKKASKQASQAEV